MFCQNCGAFDIEGAKFCCLCGESLSDVPARSTLPRRISEGLSSLKPSWDFKILFHSPNHRSVAGIGTLCKLSIFSALLFASYFVLVGLVASRHFHPFLLLLAVLPVLVFVATWGRVMAELIFLISHMERRKTLVKGTFEPRDQIQWNPERTDEVVGR